MFNGAELVERGEEQWDSARAAWNLAIDQQPALVARPGNADEVAAVLRYAREKGLRVAVQAEGHSAGPLAGVGEDTLLLKTARMTGAEVDAENRRARVAAGANSAPLGWGCSEWVVGRQLSAADGAGALPAGQERL